MDKSAAAVIVLSSENSAKSALDQIDRKKYYEPWRTQQRTIIKCGARFDVKDRTLKDWEFITMK